MVAPANATGDGNRVVIDTSKPATEPQATEEPSLLAGKFKSQDDLIAAYKALESKLGQKEPPKVDAAPEAPKADEPPAVDPVAQKAATDAYATSVAEAVGGREQMDSLFTWANANLTADEAEGVNEALKSGNVNLAKMALSGLQARYVAAEGSEPALQNGGASPVRGVTPFASSAEVIAAMRDPRYETDEAYRQTVYSRMAGNNSFTVRKGR